MDHVVNSKKTVILTILAILLCVGVGIGFSYAVWTQTEKQSDMNVFQSGCFKIEFTNESDAINLQNQFPITDEDGKKLIPYTFTVKNACSLYASYSINLEKLSGSNLDNQYIKVMLNNKRPQLYDYYSVAVKEENNSEDSRTLTTDGLGENESKTYSLRIWLDESVTKEMASKKSFSSKIVIKSVATYQSGAEYIASLLAAHGDTIKNDDPDENVRYIGTTPNNYVTFNNEPWRIIGVFDTFECEDDATVDNYTTKCSAKKLLKIIRDQSIGEYSWDSSESNVNSGWGVNEWSTSAIQKALNEAYYNSQIGTCYVGSNKSIKACDFSQGSMKGLDDPARNQVARVMWNIGTVDGTIQTYNNTNAKDMYTAERSDNNGKSLCSSGTYCNDTTPRTTKWIGKVGLMYPSDYGYGTSGGTTYIRETCLNYKLYSWDIGNYKTDCAQNSWLLNSTF